MKDTASTSHPRNDHERFRHREWAPALRAAGRDHRRVVDMRHTFATWAIEAGVELPYLARIMGTSIVQLEDTYFRWLKRTDEQLRATLDAYDESRGVRVVAASDDAGAV
jgi:integrase